MFKVGDKIKVLDDSQVGVVVRVRGNRVAILNEFGFEETFNSQELILNQDLEITDFELTSEIETKKKPNILNPNVVSEIDLHIGQLLDYTSGLSNFEMLRTQLNKVRSEIELARSEKRSRIIFIHGHGSGKLREELHKLLESYTRLEFYDASFRKYKGGATEVRLL